jgi:phosphate/sulfate permease
MMMLFCILLIYVVVLSVEVVGSLGAAWLFTFPVCGLLAFMLVKFLVAW